MAKTFAGAKIYIGSTAAINFTSDETAVAAFESETWVEITNVSNMGEFGAAANILTFPVVSDRYVKKSKGTRNAGDPALVVGRLPNDPGQQAVRAAEATDFYYNFKMVLADAESENYTDSVVYFRALVAGRPNQFGGNEDFVTETYSLGIYPGPVWVDSEFVTSPSP